MAGCLVACLAGRLFFVLFVSFLFFVVLRSNSISASSCFSNLMNSFFYTASLALWLRRPLRERKIRGSNPACDGIFPGSSHTSDFKSGTPVTTLPGAWHYKASAGTGWPGVSIL